MNYAALKYVAEECQVHGPGRAILYTIAYRADRQTGECFMSKRRIATEAGLSVTTVKRTIRLLLESDELMILITGAGRRATSYMIPTQVLSGLSAAQLRAGLVGALRPPSESVVGPSENRSGSKRPSVEGPERSPVYKEGREELEGKNGSAEPAAPPPPSPSGAAVASEPQDPRELMAKAVLSLDPEAIQDPDGWNLSERFQRAWLPNEDVAKWLRQVRGKVSA